MSQSLSWIDPEALAAALARAGVETRSRPAPRERRPDTSTQPATTSSSPAVYLQAEIPGHLAEMMGARDVSSARSSAGPPSAPSPAQAPAAAPPSAPASTPTSTSTTLPPAEVPTAAAASEPTAAAGQKIVTPARLTIPEPTAVAATQTSAPVRGSAGGVTQGDTTPDCGPPDDGEIEAFEPPASRLHARLEAFMEWVERQVHCHEMFIVDEEGLVLMERNSDPTLIAVSSYFLNFNERIRSSLGAQSEGSVSIDLKGGQTLHVVQAETRLGPHALGFTISQPLRRKVTESFRSSLPIVFGQEPG